jgi:nitrate reductase molybdenum cofactor assembly chaperone NarJ/NarW
MIELRALAALLSYPTEEMRVALPEIADAIRRSPLIASRESAGLDALVAELAAGDLMEAQECYVDLFDRSRATSLNLFEHLYGESRDRGEAMIDLKQVYARAGFELTTSELPDYLPVLLEYLSCRDIREARAMLADCAHILRSIATALTARGSAYAAVLQTTLTIAGEAPVDAASVPRRTEPMESLDRDWPEKPAFADVPLTAMSGKSTRP